MSLYRVTGTVEADDGTTYAPEFYGNEHQTAQVFAAVVDGAEQRQEHYTVALVDTTTGTVWRCWTNQPGANAFEIARAIESENL